MALDLKEAFPWIIVFVVVLGIYIYVRSRRKSKER